MLPEASHSGLLYSAEFLKQVRERLAPGGLYVRWAPSQRAAETFAAVFPHTILLMPVAVLIGSNEPIPFDPQALSRALAEPGVTEHLRRCNQAFTDWTPLFAEPPIVRRPETPRGEPPLTDVFPRDEFYLTNPVVTTDRFARGLRRPEASGQDRRTAFR